MKRNLTCIVCPMGCSIDVNIENGKVIDISGNSCPRGAEYAKNECISPVRTVTTTIRCSDGSVIPVKTDMPIPKDKVFECMKIINHTSIPLPVYPGDVIIKDVFGSNIVATGGTYNDNCGCKKQGRF